MPGGEKEYNGDTKVILHRLGEQDKQIKRILDRQDLRYEQGEKRQRENELQTALLQQSHDNICKTVEEIGKKQDRNDLWTKIIGGTEAAILAGLTYLGWKG